MMIKNRAKTGLSALFCAVGLSGCSIGSPESDVDLRAVEQNLAQESSYYLRCNSTGWQLDAASELQGAGNIRELTMTAQPWMVGGSDMCTVLQTTSPGNWTGAQPLKISGGLSVPASGTLVSGSEYFPVSFPSAGTFIAQLNVSTGELSIGQDVGGGDDPFLIKGVAVIADFSDHKFEDYTGSGINSTQEVEALLTEMEEHWSFLSRGTEEITWELRRVTLPTDLVPNAYAYWWDYRLAVIAELKTQLDAADYDADGDGQMDSVWIIAADNGLAGTSGYDYLGCCASNLDNVYHWVDQQSGGSVAGGHYGNFNHEYGHNRDLPDLYGRYATASSITLMGGASWSLPGADFDAYSRMRLGWLSPILITSDSSDVTLASAHEEFEAVRINTADPNEYFLIEYRVNPGSGYGTLYLDVDGLAIYHILETQSYDDFPPLMALVPADGVLDPEATSLELNDFLSPENAAAEYPLVVQNHDGQNVFSISGVQRTGGRMEFDIDILN